MNMNHTMLCNLTYTGACRKNHSSLQWTFFIEKSYNKEKVNYNKYRKKEKSVKKNRDMNSEETCNFKFGCLKKERK